MVMPSTLLFFSRYELYICTYIVYIENEIKNLEILNANYFLLARGMNMLLWLFLAKIFANCDCLLIVDFLRPAFAPT